MFSGPGLRHYSKDFQYGIIIPFPSGKLTCMKLETTSNLIALRIRSTVRGETLSTQLVRNHQENNFNQWTKPQPLQKQEASERVAMTVTLKSPVRRNMSSNEAGPTSLNAVIVAKVIYQNQKFPTMKPLTVPVALLEYPHLPSDNCLTRISNRVLRATT